MSLLDRLRENRSAIIEIAARHGARNVRLFGSLARGEERGDSDVDLLVSLEEGASLLDHARLQVALETLLDCRVDIASDRGLRPRVRERVLAEAVAI